MLIQQAKINHDDKFKSIDFDEVMFPQPPQLNDFTFEETKETIHVARSRAKTIGIYGSPSVNYIGKDKWLLKGFSGRNEPLLRSRIRDLCNGEVSNLSN